MPLKKAKRNKIKYIFGIANSIDKYFDFIYNK